MAKTIRFTQDFKQDLERIRFAGRPYAFVRFGDGERAHCVNRPVKAAAGWAYDGSDTPLSRKVRTLVTSNTPGMYLGISCPCCDKPSHEWYQRNMTTPIDRVTYANLFVNGNHKRFMRMYGTLKRSDIFLVSCAKGDITVPKNAVNPEWDYTKALEKLLTVRKPIFVAAGPIKCGLIYDYWTQVPEENRQIIIDIGSSLDPMIHGRATRRYQKPGTDTSTRTCVWS